MGFQWAARIRSRDRLSRPGGVERVPEGGLDAVGGQDEDVAGPHVERRRLSRSAARARECRSQARESPSAASPTGRRSAPAPPRCRRRARSSCSSTGETKARLIAAPRVSRRALWQRSTSRTRSWLGLSRTTSAGRPGGAGCLATVPEAVDRRDERALGQERDDREVAARRLAAPAPRRNAPLDRLPCRSLRHAAGAPRAGARARRGTSTSSSSRSCRCRRSTRSRSRP